MTIKRNHPARNEVAGLPNYHDSKGAAVQAVDAVLNGYGWRLDYTQTMDLHGDEGRREITIYDNVDEPTEEIGCVILYWYTMQSGRIELTVYIA